MVIILAEESLKKSENLLVMDLHPSEVQVGEYRFACAKALGEHERTAASLASRNNNFKENRPFMHKCHLAGSFSSVLALRYLNCFNIANSSPNSTSAA